MCAWNEGSAYKVMGGGGVEGGLGRGGGRVEGVLGGGKGERGGWGGEEVIPRPHMTIT